jgi:hypothetical protein
MRLPSNKRFVSVEDFHSVARGGRSPRSARSRQFSNALDPTDALPFELQDTIEIWVVDAIPEPPAIASDRDETERERDRRARQRARARARRAEGFS